MPERKFIRRTTSERRAFARFYFDIVDGLSACAKAERAPVPDQVRRALNDAAPLSLEDVSNAPHALGYRIGARFVKLPAAKEQAPDG